MEREDYKRICLCPDIESFEAIKETLLFDLGNSENTRNIILACEELFVNIAKYSEADDVTFLYAKAEESLTVIFSDDGIPFDPADTIIGERDFDELDSGGMGIMLAHLYSQEMYYSRTDGRNVLTLVFRI